MSLGVEVRNPVWEERGWEEGKVKIEKERKKEMKFREGGFQFQ